MNWDVDKIYVLNNFSSNYLARAIDHGNVFCAGEIDPAIGLCANDNIEEIHAVEIDPKTAALGEWKKQAIKTMDETDYFMSFSELSYPSYLSSYAHSCGLNKISNELWRIVNSSNTENSEEKYKTFKESFDSEKKYENIRKMLPEEIGERIEGGMPKPIGDCGTLVNLGHIITNYQKIRENIDKLKIINGEAISTVKQFPNDHFDYISLNNILDYCDWQDSDIIETFKFIKDKLKNKGNVLLATTMYNDEKMDKLVGGRGAVKNNSSTIGCVENKGKFLRGYKDIEEMKRLNGRTSPVQVNYRGKEIYLNDVIKRIGFNVAHLDINISHEYDSKKTPTVTRMVYGEKNGRIEDQFVAVEAYQKVV